MSRTEGPNRVWTDHDFKQIAQMRADRDAWVVIALRFGCEQSTIRKAWKRHQQSLTLREQVTTEQVIVDDLNNPRIQSLLVKGEVNMDLWQPTKAVVNEWAGNFQAKVWLKYMPELASLESLREEILSDIARVSKDVRDEDTRPDLIGEPGDHLLEMSPFDMHIGKLGWGEEVLDNYDSDIAVERYKESIRVLARRGVASFDIGRVLLVLGNDFAHIDSKVSTTTAGTYQDTDTRWHKIFRTTHEMGRWAIEYLVAFGKPVDVIIVPGNHDELTTFAMGEVLRASYRDHPLVNIDNRAVPRKYYRYGCALLGFTHGDRERHAELPMIMADESRQDWAEVRFSEWHIGHRHNKKSIKMTAMDQYRITGVRILPSLCGQDYWHYKQGYRHHPQSESHVWSKEQGHVATFTFTADPTFRMERPVGGEK